MPSFRSYIAYFLVMAFCFTTIFIGYDLLLFNMLPEEDGAFDRDSLNFLMRFWLMAGPALSLFVVLLEAAKYRRNMRRYPESASRPQSLQVGASAWESFTQQKSLRLLGREIRFTREADGLYRGRIPYKPWAPAWIRITLVPLQQQDHTQPLHLEVKRIMPDFAGMSIRTHHLLAEAFQGR